MASSCSTIIEITATLVSMSGFLLFWLIIYFFEAHESRENDTQTRTISCIRCAAYLRPFPRIHPQNQRAQTHSHGRVMLASATEIALPSCVAVFFCFSLRIHTSKSVFSSKYVVITRRPAAEVMPGCRFLSPLRLCPALQR